jgi:hypothetical protein
MKAMNQNKELNVFIEQLVLIINDKSFKKHLNKHLVALIKEHEQVIKQLLDD